ncbi:hypothetical protein RSAG8_00065, partial [Rhizoctonia solani AG-8 WAC10335]
MQLVFTPALGSTTTLAVVPGTTVQFAARVSTRDYNEAVANGTRVELWGDLPCGGAAGEWAATRFEPAPVAPEHHDSGAPPNVLSLLPADPEPVPTTSAAPETTLLVTNFTIPADVESADYQFTYRLAHSNESSTWHTWLGDAGSNGHLIINQEAPAIEGLIFAAGWSSEANDARLSPADGTVATLAGPVDWSGWALDLDPTSESPATPQRFSTLPKALSATHLALFPNPGLTTLNPASHTPVFVSTSSRLSINDRALSSQGSPIKVTPLSRSAVEASLPDHAVLLPESTTTPPFAVVHDTRGNSLSILPIAPVTPGTQVISLDLDQAKIAASSPGKSLLFSPSANKAALYTQDTRVAVPVLGADVQEGKHSVLGFLQGVVAVVIYYVTRGAWSVFSRGFRKFGTGAHAGNAAPAKPADVESPVHETTELPPTGTITPKDTESESGSDTGSLNEVAPTPIESRHAAHIAVVDPQGGETSHSAPSGDSPSRRPQEMPLTPPLSPKTVTQPFVIPGPSVEPVVVSKPKLAFTAPEKATLVVVSSAPDAVTDELEVKVGGGRIPTAWDAYEGKTWLLEVEVGKENLEVALA